MPVHQMEKYVVEPARFPFTAALAALHGVTSIQFRPRRFAIDSSDRLVRFPRTDAPSS